MYNFPEVTRIISLSCVLCDTYENNIASQVVLTKSIELNWIELNWIELNWIECSLFEKCN